MRRTVSATNLVGRGEKGRFEFLHLATKALDEIPVEISGGSPPAERCSCRMSRILRGRSSDTTSVGFGLVFSIAII